MKERKLLMTRYKIIVEEGVYHLTQRAPGKELLFLEEEDYLFFLKRLKETSNKFKISIFCFALLPNHLHLLLKIQEKNLDKGMKFLFQSYAQYFNKKYQRKGHVFCGRYRISFCDKDNYLLAISLYIHLNPFKARLTKDMFSYRWFSLQPYIKSTKSTFLDVIPILTLLNNNLEKARNIYKEVFRISNNTKYESILKSPKGTSNFINNFYQYIKKNLKKNLKKKGVLPYVLLSKWNKQNESWEELEKRIGEVKGKRWLRKPWERKALAYLIKQLLSSGYTLTEISQKIGIHRTSIYRLIKTTDSSLS